MPRALNSDEAVVGARRTLSNACRRRLASSPFLRRGMARMRTKSCLECIGRADSALLLSLSGPSEVAVETYGVSRCIQHRRPPRVWHSRRQKRPWSDSDDEAARLSPPAQRPRKGDERPPALSPDRQHGPTRRRLAPRSPPRDSQKPAKRTRPASPPACLKIDDSSCYTCCRR
jgi:type IV secretory pathway VirB10-like protein